MKVTFSIITSDHDEESAVLNVCGPEMVTIRGLQMVPVLLGLYPLNGGWAFITHD